MPEKMESILFSNTLKLLREEEEKNRPTLIQNVLDALSKRKLPSIPNSRPLEV